mgnify:CR=1 FL=1
MKGRSGVALTQFSSSSEYCSTTTVNCNTPLTHGTDALMLLSYHSNAKDRLLSALRYYISVIRGLHTRAHTDYARW